MKTILITGAKGQLGSELFDRTKNLMINFNCIFTDVEELDICDESAVTEFFKNNSPDYLINCAAYTAVDKAEDEPDTAYRINRDAVEYLALACQKFNTRMFHISTDYVFDGKNFKPYTEEDEPNPVSVYGKSKYEGELAVQKHLNNAYILRTSWVYSAYGNNFVKTILHLAKEREELNVIVDQVGTPTYAGDLAEAIFTIVNEIENKEADMPGLYHYSNEGVASWYDFACEIVNNAGLKCRINPIPSSAYPTKAKRPFYSILNKTLLREKLFINIPDWKRSLLISDCLNI